MRLLGVAFLLTCVVVSGCATLVPAPKADDSRLGQYNFAYAIEQREQTGLVQVFDDGVKTYLQFHDLAAVKPRISTPENEMGHEYEPMNNFAVVTGVHALLTVTTDTGRSVVHRELEVRPIAQLSTDTAPE